MEEVDSILILNLRTLGCPVDDSIKSVADIGTDLLVECAGRCLRAIAPETVWPLALPKAMSARFRICTNMAKKLSSMGFSGEVGYHQFLYPNEPESRAMLLFLVERLPKGSNKDDDEGEAVAVTPRERADRAVSLFCSGGWIPRVLSRRAEPFSGRTFGTTTTDQADRVKPSTDDEAYNAYASSTSLRTLPGQVSTPASLIPTVVSLSAQEMARTAEIDRVYGAGSSLHGGAKLAAARRERQGAVRSSLAEAFRTGRAGVASLRATGGGPFDSLVNAVGGAAYTSGSGGSAFAHAVGFSVENDATAVSGGARTEADARAEAEAEQKRMEAEVDAARARIMELSGSIEAAERECMAALAELRQREQDLAQEKAKRAGLEAQYTAKKTTIDMLSDVDGNARELRKIADASRARLVELATEWEKRRVPIVEAIRATRDGLARRRRECDRKLEQVKTMRAEMKQMIQQAREREETHRQSLAEYERMPKDVSRALYTRRILDIVKNVKKQDAEIQKILADSRNVRKEINTATEAMARAYGTCDEVVFKKASQDANVKPAYKAVVELHATFEQLATFTDQTGQASNNSRDTQARIDQIAARNDSNNEERVMSDLKEIKAENAALLKRLKAREQ